MTTETAPVPRGELVGVQYLRGLAAAMVVLLHLTGQIARRDPAFAVPYGLGAGVDIFFVISGFVMAYSTGEGAAMGPGRFLLRRLVRIVPLYWAVSAVMLAILLLAPGVTQSARLDWSHVLRSFLFLPAPHPHPANGGLFFPLIVPGWTINLEMFFYLVFAAGLALGGRRRLVPLAGTSAILVAVVLLGADGPPMAPRSAMGFYANPRLFEFVGGMWLAVAFRRLPRPPLAVLLTAGALAAVVLALAAGDGANAVGAAFWSRAAASVVLVYAGACLTGPTYRTGPAHRMAAMLGDSSYSLYLSQTFTVSAWGQVGTRLGLFDGGAGRVLFLAGGMVAAAAGGWLCWRFVERPVTAATRRAVEPGPPSRPLVGAESGR